MRAVLLAGLAGTLACVSASAHDGVVHGSAAEAEAHLKATQSTAPPLPDGPPVPFPIDLEVAFDLIDQTGTRRTEADFAGQPMAIFFGYANCEAICSVALPRLASTLDLLGPQGEELQAILITVDPERDTPEAMAEALPDIHPRMIGLTGEDENLQAVRDVFQVEAKVMFEDPEGNPIYAHGSYIYVIDAEGELATVLPPILGPERMAEVITKYL